MLEKDIVIDMRALINEIKNKVENNMCVVISGEGNSMLPFIAQDDNLTLEKGNEKTVRTGNVYLYRRSDGSYAIHRIYKVKGDYVWMLGDAQLFIEKDVHKSSLVAVVTKVQKPEKTIDCTKTLLRFRCVIRMKLRIAKYIGKYKIKYFTKRVKRIPSKIKRMFLKER